MTKWLKDAKNFYFLGYNAKPDIVYMLLFVVVGLVFSYVDNTGIFFLMAAPMWLVQTIITLPAVDLVKGSPKRKMLEITMPAVIGFVGMLLLYIVFGVVVWMRSRNGYVQQDYMAGFMIQAGSYAMLTLFYCGMAFKYMVASSVIYFVLEFFVIFGFQYDYLEQLFVGMPFYVGAIIGFVELCVGALLQCGIARLLYKYPLSKHAQTRQVSKLMK